MVRMMGTGLPAETAPAPAPKVAVEKAPAATPAPAPAQKAAPVSRVANYFSR